MRALFPVAAFTAVLAACVLAGLSVAYTWTGQATGTFQAQVGVWGPTPSTPQPPSELDCQFLSFFRAQLEWTASPSPGVEGYRIYHRGPLGQAFSLLDEVPGASTTYDELRPSFLRHRYVVTAFLQSSESEPSNTIQVHCRPALFNLPAPCHLTAENHHSQRVIELTWEEVANATDYAVLRATTSGGPYDIVIVGSRPATTYIDAAVSEGVTYYYLVLALDAEGNESDPSQEVAVPDTVPMPTPAPTAAVTPTPSPTPIPTASPAPSATPEPAPGGIYVSVTCQGQPVAGAQVRVSHQSPGEPVVWSGGTGDDGELSTGLVLNARSYLVDILKEGASYDSVIATVPAGGYAPVYAQCTAVWGTGYIGTGNSY